jgi:flagellar biosynthesis/type III secretory pathway protein FliH
VVDAVRTAMHALGEPDDIVLRLNPRDLAVLTELCEDPLPPRTRLVPDADVAEGDVLAVTPVQRLHLSMPTAIAAAEEVLRS